jgi:competence transcription factor ComK
VGKTDNPADLDIPVAMFPLWRMVGHTVFHFLELTVKMAEMAKTARTHPAAFNPETLNTMSKAQTAAVAAMQEQAATEDTAEILQ